jgi:hypothetical protein
VLGVIVGVGIAAGVAALLGRPRVAPAAAQWRWPPTIFLPMTGSGVDVKGLPAPPTAPPSPTPTVTPEATLTPTPLPCGELGERVTVTEIDVGPDTIQARRDPRTRATPMPVMLAVGSGSRMAAAWSDTAGDVHVTPLDTSGRAGPDLTVPGVSVRGLVVHTDGYALLVVRGDEMHLVRVNDSGAVRWEKKLVGGVSQTVTGNKWVDSWGHQSRLVFADGEYAAYFGHTQYFGADGKHQGDLLWLFDEAGERIEESGRGARGWNWGCSHSLDVRLAHNGTRLGPVCLSDAYPTKGIHFDHEVRLRSEPSGDMRGFSAANLGGWVPLAERFVLSFSSPEGRTSSDVGMLDVTDLGEVGEETWLTNTSTVDESAPHLAAYGPERGDDPQFLAGWLAGDRLHLAEARAGTGVTGGPVAVDVEIGEHDDFVTLPGGHVGWAFAWDDFQTLKQVTVRWCER